MSIIATAMAIYFNIMVIFDVDNRSLMTIGVNIKLIVQGCQDIHTLVILFCRGCLLVRQSFFHNDPKNFADVGGGVLGCRGFHSSFRTTQGGLSLNIGSFSLLNQRWAGFKDSCFVSHENLFFPPFYLSLKFIQMYQLQ